MGINCDAANVFDLDITRPDRTGPGGDAPSDAAIASGLSAIYEEAHDVVTEVDGRQIEITGRFWIDPTDATGALIDARAGDWVQWTDASTARVRKQEIRRWSPGFLGSEILHFLIEV